ncbi:cyclic nucleotide-binding domain-containing protein [Sneathiella limimaris]|uniref:cyclic nucleotide-binding domain-containing protein n=1 Tax=Sneathiella limimaris TaxID=1964213 RepID=UPI00146E2DA3|nr:cyclic nucleotide-binding domain-containing protein [Sneathiella limimaris]
MAAREIIDSVAASEMFRGLPTELIESSLPHFKISRIEKGQIILREGTTNSKIHIIHTGEAEVLKSLEKESGDNDNSFVIATLQPGEEFGELTAIEGTVASATIRASKPMELITLDLRQQNEDQNLKELYDQIQVNLIRRIASKLRDTSERKVALMEQESKRRREQAVAGRFIITILSLVACYTLALRAIMDLGTYGSWLQVYYSPLIIVAFMGAMLFMMARSEMPFEAFGLTLKGWKPAIKDAVLFSIPFCAFITFLKWEYIVLYPDPGGMTVFTLTEMFSSFTPGGDFSWMAYLTFFLAYVLLCPVQELIARCGVQAPLSILLQGSHVQRHFLAILVSNLLYSASHSHLNLGFAFITFVPGLFWGWLFMRHKSLIGVSVSHAIVGGYALFALGIEEFLK